LKSHLLFKLAPLFFHLLALKRLLPGRCPAVTTTATTATTAHRSSLLLLLKINGAQHAHHGPLAHHHPDQAV
jgi:hypothetical protein